MISIGCKYFKIPKLIIQGVPVLMMDHVARLQGKMFGHFHSGDPLALSGRVIRSFLFGFQESVITFMRTMQRCSIPDLTPMPCKELAARMAGYVKVLVIGWVNTVALQELPDPLPGPVVLSGKVNHGYQVNGIGVDNVNFLFRCQSYGHVSSLVSG